MLSPSTDEESMTDRKRGDGTKKRFKQRTKNIQVVISSSYVDISDFPDICTKQIFLYMYLHLKEMGNLSLVNHQWRNLIPSITLVVETEVRLS